VATLRVALQGLDCSWRLPGRKKRPRNYTLWSPPMTLFESIKKYVTFCRRGASFGHRLGQSASGSRKVDTFCGSCNRPVCLLRGSLRRPCRVMFAQILYLEPRVGPGALRAVNVRLAAEKLHSLTRMCLKPLVGATFLPDGDPY